MASFRALRRWLGPRWLTTDGESGLLGYALDILTDAFAERLRLGLLARFPQQDPDGTPAPPDALAALGRDRRVVRGIGESAESYAERLTHWLDEAEFRGNPFALLKKIAEYTGPGLRARTVDARGNWFTREADGTLSARLREGNWDWDGKPYDGESNLRWSRFWVILYPSPLWSPSRTWGDGSKWGEPRATWGSTMTPGEVATLRSIVSEWMPEGTRCVNIILAFDPDSFDPSAPLGDGLPDGLWENWSKNVGGVQVPARLASARYLDGV